MDTDDFAKQLAASAPSKSALARAGLGPTETETFARTFRCVRQEVTNPEEGWESGFWDGWDLGDVEIGMIRFLSSPVVRGNVVHIGFVEADPLLVDYESGSVFAEEMSHPGHTLWRVAKNREMLLDALVCAAEFLSKRGVGEIDFDDDPASRACARSCASLAGGDEYLPFYLMLVG